MQASLSQGDVKMMELFTTKFCNRSISRVDLMMEERGGWIVGEAHKHDTKMLDVVIGVMAKANQQIKGEELNSFKDKIGEILSSNLERNFSGFFVRKYVILFGVNSQKFLAHVVVLKKHLVIAKFVGPNDPQHNDIMVENSKSIVEGGGTLSLYGSVGKNLFFFSGENKDALDNRLMLSPFIPEWGTCMLQNWVLRFNPDNPNNLVSPT